MAWHALTIAVLPGAGGAAARALFALGCVGLEEDPDAAPRQLWEVEGEDDGRGARLLRAWFEDPDRDAIAAALAGYLAPGAAPTWREERGEDWGEAWRAAFRPIVVTRHLTIAPPWDAPQGALVIEPGQGFGTGQHATTRLALRALEALCGPDADAREVGPVEDVLDVGCGSGVVCLAAARLGRRARGVDVEPAAIEEARANAARNALQVELSVGGAEDAGPPADLVIANHHAELLLELGPALLARTRRWLALSGILAAREPAVRAAFEGAGLRLVAREEEDGWVALRLRRA